MPDSNIAELALLRARVRDLEEQLSRYNEASSQFGEVANYGQNHFHSLLSLFPVGVSICLDPSCREIRHNPVAARFLRIGDWEVLSHSSNEASSVKILCEGREISPEELPIQKSFWKGEKVHRQELEFVWQDGVRKFALWSSRPLMGIDGQIIGAISAMEDITDRKRIEEELKESEEKYRNLIRHAPTFFYEIDFHGPRFITVNDMMCEYLGYTREELFSMSPMDLLDNNSKIAFQARTSQWLSGQKPDKNVEYRVLAKDGQEFYVILNVTFISDENGPKGATVVGYDITERKLAENSLRESQALLEAVMSSITDGLAVIDSHGNYRYFNDSLARINGFQSKEEYFKRSSENDLEAYDLEGKLLSSEDLPLNRALRGEVLSGYELKLKCKDTDDSRITSYSCAPVHDENGNIVAAVATVRDITQQKRIEEQLRESDRQKNEFLGTLSHELRNPLAAIQYSLNLLDWMGPNGDQAMRAKEVIVRQFGLLNRLVDDLLDVTRMLNSKIKLQRERLELNELVRRTAEDHRDIFEENGVELEFVPAPSPAFVNADHARLSQVVGNFLHNAAKFTNRGGKTTLSVEVREEHAAIHVIDTGAGMSPKTLSQLFRPFMQAEATLDRSSGGLGLGLALAKGLTELHGGELTARSAGVGQGSEFIVRLPLDMSPVLENTLIEPSNTFRSRQRVLIIDDNIDIVETLRELLELEGYEAIGAYDGPEGLAKAREFQPEVVLCDIGLPGMTGYEVARAFRADRELNKAFLVALTGYALPEDLKKASRAGFDGHLAKPVDLETIEKLLDEVPDQVGAGPSRHLA